MSALISFLVVMNIIIVTDIFISSVLSGRFPSPFYIYKTIKKYIYYRFFNGIEKTAVEMSKLWKKSGETLDALKSCF